MKHLEPTSLTTPQEEFWSGQVDIIRKAGENNRPVDAERFEELDPAINPRTREATRRLYGGTFLHEPSSDNLLRLRSELVQLEQATRSECAPSGRVSRLLRDVTTTFFDIHARTLRQGRAKPDVLCLNQAGEFLAPTIEERLGTRPARSAQVERRSQLKNGIQIPCYEITAWHPAKKRRGLTSQIIFDVATSTAESILVCLAELQEEQSIHPEQVTVASLYVSPCAVERLHRAGIARLVVGELAHGVSPLGQVLVRTPEGYRHAIGNIDQWIETRKPFLRLHGLLPIPELK